MTKKSRQKLKYLENEKRFKGEIKTILIIFKGLSDAKYCLKPESAPLNLRLEQSRQQTLEPNLTLRTQIFLNGSFFEKDGDSSPPGISI